MVAEVVDEPELGQHVHGGQMPEAGWAVVVAVNCEYRQAHPGRAARPKVGTSACESRTCAYAGIASS